MQFISDDKGSGLIATKFIPAGTVTYVQDALDIVIEPEQLDFDLKIYKELIDKYAFTDQFGRRIVSWDNSKYMNHCCFANTLTTGYGFEIAVRDIQDGEEVTDDYGIFTVGHKMKICCSRGDCLHKIDPNDFEERVAYWDEQILSALKKYPYVDQPLFFYFDRIIREQVASFFKGTLPYVSVRHQKPGSRQILEKI